MGIDPGIASESKWQFHGKMQLKGKVSALLHKTKVTICIGFVGLDNRYVTSLQEQRQQPQHSSSSMSLMLLLHGEGMITQV
jgi:hypothetical protein